MDPLPLSRAFTLVEPGPVILVTTHDGTRPNIMTISWTMVRSFDAEFALTTGPWNHSWTALCDSRACVLAIPTAGYLPDLWTALTENFPATIGHSGGAVADEEIQVHRAADRVCLAAG